MIELLRQLSGQHEIGMDIETQGSQKKTKTVTVGERVIYRAKEWKVAEQTEDQVVLYRERVDGSSEVERLTMQEIERLLPTPQE
ncbi:MAG: hypothetical protein ACE5DP_02310 [Fidelibacterota bacterium]